MDQIFLLAPTSTEQRTQPALELELLAVATDEVQHRAHRLARMTPQAAPQLLQEQRRTVRWP